MKRKLSELSNWTPKQCTASSVADAHKYMLFGGSRGPGKSHFLRWYGAKLVLYLREKFGVKNPMVGLFCEDYPVLRDRQIKMIKNEFPREMGEVKSTQDEGLGFFFHDGGMLALRNLDDASKYQSAEFAGILIDELTKNTVDIFNLRGSLRCPGVPDIWLKFIGATNPGGIGHLWVKDYFVDKVYPPELEPHADKFAFVPALPDDNPHLGPEYWDMLASLPPDLARAWRWGEWDIFEGQVFTNWRRSLHVVDPFKIPDDWPRWRAVDWGYSAPFCCLWLARNPDTGQVIVYRETYKTGLTDPEQADLIRELTGQPKVIPPDEDPDRQPLIGKYAVAPDEIPEPEPEVEPGENILMTLADPSMWTKRTMERKTLSSAQVYKRHGVPLTKANNDRLTGLRRVRDVLMWEAKGQPLYCSDDPRFDGKPGLLIFSTCVNLIRTLPALPHDKVRVEDVDTNAEDHPYDTLRYSLTRKVAQQRKDPER